MSGLLLQIIAGIIVALVSGITGFIVKKRFFNEFFLLPKADHYIETGSYSHLNGDWHLYWLSYSHSNNSVPLWMHGRQRLKIKKARVEGSSEFVDHVYKHLHFKLQGEIRAGR